MRVLTCGNAGRSAGDRLAPALAAAILHLGRGPSLEALKALQGLALLGRTMAAATFSSILAPPSVRGFLDWPKAKRSRLKVRPIPSGMRQLLGDRSVEQRTVISSRW